MFSRVKLCLIGSFLLGVAVVCGCEADEAEACDYGTTFSFTQPVCAQPVFAQEVYAQPVYAQQFVQPVYARRQVIVQRNVAYAQPFVGRQVVRQRTIVRGGYGPGLGLRVGF